MLFVNAVGGAPAFQRAAGNLIAKVLDGLDVVSGDVGSASPLLTGKAGDFRGPPIGKLQRSRSWTKALPSFSGVALTVYQLDGRPVVVFGRYGIHDTLDGHSAYGAQSYLPASARDLAANICLVALANRPKAPATQPAPKGKGAVAPPAK
jgi:hypothetical protein